MIITNYYEIRYDATQNRLFLTLRGFWRSKEELANYLPDLNRVLSKVQKGFTLLVNLTELKTNPADVQSLHLEAQKLVIDKGLVYTAEVVASSFIEFQTSQYSKKSEMPLKQFSNPVEVEDFLDKIQEKIQTLA